MKKTQHSRKYKRLLAVIKQARLDADLSQDNVSKMMGKYRTFLSKVEAGERRLDVVELSELCKLYGKGLLQVLKEANIE